MTRYTLRKMFQPAARRGRAAAGGALLVALVSAASLAQPSPAPAQGSAEAFLRKLYAPYAHSSMTTHETVWDRPETVFTPAAAATLRANLRNDEPGALDGDAFCDCQDWTRITVDKVTVRVDARTAEAAVHFHDVREPPRTVHYKLARVGDAWRVADVLLNGDPASHWLMPVLRAENAAGK